jgi:hypothetical protein
MRHRFQSSLLRYNLYVKRILRILRSASILLSLFLAISLIALWVRSHSMADRVAFGVDASDPDGSPRRHMKVARSNRGRIAFIAYTIRGSMLTRSDSLNPPGLYVTHLPAAQDANNDLVWEKLGFQYLRYRRPPTIEGSGMRIPIWFLTLIFTVPPLLWLIRYLRRAKPSSRLCATCGYDLRATPNRCPECGTAPPSPSSSPSLPHPTVPL